MTRPVPLSLGLSLLCAGLAAWPAAAPGQGSAAVPELNRKVLAFAEAHKGEQVGNGECWTLAADALSAAGAQRPGANGVNVLNFGRKLEPNEAILPGDVIQFEKAKFVHKTPTSVSSETMPHHTAIVVRAKGKRVTLIHQNVNGKRTVQVTTLNLAERTQGTVDIYRPEPALVGRR